MALKTIPTRTDLDNYALQVELDGTTYTITLAWSYRDEAWYLSLADDLGTTPIASGIRINADTPLLRSCSSALKPPGSLIAVDTAGHGEAPGLEDLGERVHLLYSEATP